MARQKRQGITKSTRFEVFKRDKFTCQYCGRASPDVILEVDHIQPASKGGDNSVLNYVTACQDCNAGKSDKVLADDSAVKRSKRQLDDMQERREQLELMLAWQRELANMDNVAVDGMVNLWEELVTPYGLSDIGRSALKTLIKKYGVLEVGESMRISYAQYIQVGDDGNPARESVIQAFKKIAGVCAVRKSSVDKPYLHDLFIIRKILRERGADCKASMTDMENALNHGVSIEAIKAQARDASSPGGFYYRLKELIEGLNNA